MAYHARADSGCRLSRSNDAESKASITMKCQTAAKANRKERTRKRKKKLQATNIECNPPPRQLMVNVVAKTLLSTRIRTFFASKRNQSGKRCGAPAKKKERRIYPHNHYRRRRKSFPKYLGPCSPKGWNLRIDIRQLTLLRKLKWDSGVSLCIGVWGTSNRVKLKSCFL